jgi:hypothetical protein
MNALEWILLIFVAVETTQIFYLAYNTYKMRKTLELVVKDADFMGQALNSMVFGFMDRITKNEKDQHAFFGFIATCGLAMYEGILQRVKGEGAGQDMGAGIPLEMIPKKYRGIVALLEPVIKSFTQKQGQVPPPPDAAGWG